MLTSIQELLILISSQFKLTDTGMEVIYSEKPDLITTELVEKCLCLLLLSIILRITGLDSVLEQAKSVLSEDSYLL